MAIRIETQSDHESESMCYLARAQSSSPKRGDRCVLEVREYGGPPQSVEQIQARLCWKVRTLLGSMDDEVPDHYFVEQYRNDGEEQHWVKRNFEQFPDLETQYEAEDAVTREALNSIWNSYGGDQIADDKHGIVCRTAAAGLDQSVISCISSWDENAVFARSFWATDKGELGRVEAIIASMRRVVDKGIADGILKEVPNSVRYSVGVTFVSGREL